MGRLQIKIATELELAEEMSNSSPERAMELLSSTGKPQCLILYSCFSVHVNVMFLMEK